MSQSKVQRANWKAGSKIGLAVASALLLIATGCSDRISPAAPLAKLEAAADDKPSDVAPEAPQATSSPEPVAVTVHKADIPAEQLASVEPVATPATQETPAKPKVVGRIRDITFDDIKFEMTKEEPFLRKMITPKIEKLFGSRIRVRGYILPTDRMELTQFVLMRDNRECCFGPGAALFDAIVVEMAPQKTAKFTNFMVTVEGTFSLEEIKYPDDESRHLAIYRMVADKVR